MPFRPRPEDYPEGSTIRAQIEREHARSAEILEKAIADDAAVKEVLKKRPDRPEQELQRRLIARADSWPMGTLVTRHHWPAAFGSSWLGEYLFHIPNGGARTPVEAAIFKALGVRPGVFDLFLMIPTRRVNVIDGPEGMEEITSYCAGLWLELKADRGKLSDHQQAFAKKAELVGYETNTVRSEADFDIAIETYLRGARAWA